MWGGDWRCTRRLWWRTAHTHSSRLAERHSNASPMASSVRLRESDLLPSTSDFVSCCAARLSSCAGGRGKWATVGGGHWLSSRNAMSDRCDEVGVRCGNWQAL